MDIGATDDCHGPMAATKKTGPGISATRRLTEGCSAEGMTIRNRATDKKTNTLSPSSTSGSRTSSSTRIRQDLKPRRKDSNKNPSGESRLGQPCEEKPSGSSGDSAGSGEGEDGARMQDEGFQGGEPFPPKRRF